MNRCYIRVLILIAVLIMTTAASATEPCTIVLGETDWTWEGEQIAYFEGTVSSSESLPEKVKLKLTLSAFPEGADPGKVVFSNVNGKKLTIKKQQSEYVLSAEGLDSFPFTGNWKTPENVPFTRVEITFQILDEKEENLLGEQKMTVTRDASEAVQKDDGKIRLKENFSGWTAWAGAAAVVIWILAGLRILINHRKR